MSTAPPGKWKESFGSLKTPIPTTSTKASSNSKADRLLYTFTVPTQWPPEGCTAEHEQAVDGPVFLYLSHGKAPIALYWTHPKDIKTPLLHWRWGHSFFNSRHWRWNTVREYIFKHSLAKCTYLHNKNTSKVFGDNLCYINGTSAPEPLYW